MSKRETDLLYLANQKLESEISNLATELKDCEFGHLAWMQTYYSLRLDDLEGLIKEYFLNEIDNNNTSLNN